MGIKTSFQPVAFPSVNQALEDVRVQFGIQPKRKFTPHELEVASRFDSAAELKRVRAKADKKPS